MKIYLESWDNMKLYVIRHGRTNCNDQGKYNGKLDEDINETGIEQAKLVSKEIEKLNIDLIICSPLLRTKHTCDIININNIPVIYDKRLEERDCGKLTNENLGDFYFTDYWNYYSDKKIEGLETIPELFERIAFFLDEIKEKYKNKNILLVTHGGIARGVYFYFNRIPEDGDLKNFGSSNCGIKEYEL